MVVLTEELDEVLEDPVELVVDVDVGEEVDVVGNELVVAVEVVEDDAEEATELVEDGPVIALDVEVAEVDNVGKDELVVIVDDFIPT